MTSTKTNAPIINLDEQTYKLCDFSEDLAKYVANNSVGEKSDKKHSKQLVTWYSKGILRIKMKNPYCPECNSTSINLNALYYRKLYYYDRGEVNAGLQKYKCKKCGKEFITDIGSIVEGNSNFTLDFKEKALELVGLFYGSVRKVAQRVKNDTGINISHQTIENWILDVEKPKKLANWFLSGYYGFDSQWVWNNNKWNYRLALYDTKLNIPVANEIFSTESKKNVQDFIDKNTLNQNKYCITTDLDENYKSPIENLGFNHQYCTVHSKKNINKKINEYIRDNKVSDEEINFIKLFKKDIFELYDCESYDEARDYFDSMLCVIDDYPPIIQSIILDSIMPSFKTYFYHLIDDNVDKTNNKIENYFLKTFPRHVKKIMKTFEGILSRICLRQKFWGKYCEIQI